MANGGSIRYSVGFDVNSADLNQLKASLQAIQKQASQVSGTGKLQKEFKEASDAAKKLEQILNSSWNSKLQQFNLDKVNQGINQTYGSVKQLKAEMEKGGAAGAAAYNQVASSLLTTNLQLKQSNKLLDDMATSFANTIKWGISSSIFNNMTSSIQKAWSFTKNLDSSLNDIRIVTNQSAESMEEFAVSANKAAKELGASTLDYTNAALIYYQQGLSAEEVNARAETTLKAANVTGQRGEEVSEQLTAVWNGYKVTAEEAELYVDKLAAVAATTASDLQELSVGMSKVASAANLMGVDVDQLNAQLATIVSITRQAPESVGTALKTIYARMGDIEAGLDGETSLDSYTEKMAQMGYNVLDANGKLRDMGEVITEIGENWQNMSREQQLALSQTVAGTRQYNNLLALFDNWDMYTDALNTSAHAAGTLQKQQDIYMESTEAHLKSLKAETQRTYDLLFNQEVVNGFIDVFNDSLGILNDFIDGLGGGGKALTYLGSIASQVFNKQISQGILKVKQDFDLLKANLRGEDFVNNLIGEGVSSFNAQSGIDVGDAGYGAQLEAAKEIFAVRRGLTQEQYQESLEINKQIGLTAQKVANLQKEQHLDKDKLEKLKEIKITEDTDLALIKSRIGYRQKENAELNDMRSDFVEMQFLEAEILSLKSKNALTSSKQQEIEQKLITYKQTYVEYLARQGRSTQEIEARWTRLSTSLLNGNLHAATFERILNNIKTSETENNAIISAGLELIRAKSPELAKELEIENKKYNVLKNQNTEIAKQGSQGVNTQKIVKGASAATGAIMALTGSLTTFADASASAEQKSHAVGSALGGIAMAVLPAVAALGPWGMAIGAVVAAISSLVFSLDGVEDFFKTTEEKLEELTQTQQEYINKTKEFTDAKKSLEEVADEYEALAEKAGEYDSTIENLTDAERDRYNELKNTILQYNSEALLGYNAEGEAILKKNQGIQDTIDLLKEEYEQKVKNQFVDNWKDTKQTLNQQIEDKKSAVEFAQGEVDALESGVKMPSTNDVLFVNSQVEEILKYETDAILEQDEAAQQAFDDLRDAWNNGTLTEESINSFITTINETDSPVKDSLINVANSIKDEITSYDTELANAKDVLEQSELELQNYKFNTQEILSALKFDVEGNGAEWQQLESLNLDGFDTVIAQYIDNLSYQEGTMDSVDDAIAATREYVSNLYTVLSKLENPQTFLDDVKNFSIVDFDTLEDYNQVAVNKINNIIQSNIALFEHMEDDQKKALFEGLFGFSNIIFKDNKAVSIETPYDNNKAAFYEEKYKKTKSNITDIDSGLNILTSDEELDETQLQKLDGLSKKYEELGQIQNKNSHEYLAMLRQIREQEEDNARIALEKAKQIKEEELNALVKEIDNLDMLYDNAIAAGNEEGALQYQAELSLKTDEFTAKMKELQEADYSIKMQIEADLASDVDDAFGLADELGNLQELIGEDLTLTFEEAQNIIKQGYGEILQGAKETTEQTIVLNKEQVNAYINGKEAEIQADKDAKIEQLENEREILVAQETALKNKLEALGEAKKAESKQEAVAALQKVQNADKEYRLQVQKLNEELKKTSDAAIKTENINENLYNSLGGMYETDSLNQQLATIDATDVSAENLQVQIDNVHAVHDAYSALANQIRSMPAHVDKSTTTTSKSSGNTQTNSSTSVEGTGNYEYDPITEEDLTDLWDDTKNELTQAYQDTIAAQEKVTQDQLDAVQNSLGAIDAGIAALKSAGSSLNKYQNGLSKDAKKDGKDKDKERDTIELLDEKEDIYHDINIEIDQLSRNLDRLNNKEDKLFGKNLINNLNQQLATLDKRIDAQKKKIEIAQKEANQLKKALSNQGVKFDENGNISNYISALEKSEAKVNSVISAYNKLDAEAQKEAKSGVEAEKKRHENLKKTIEKYEELINDTIPELTDSIEEDINRKIEIQIQKFTMEVEIRLEMAEAERDWNEFKKKVLDGFDDDDPIGNALAAMADFSSYYKDSNTGEVQILTQHLNRTLEEYQKLQATGWSDVYGDNEAQLLEDLEKYRTALQEALLNAQETVETVKEAYLDMIDLANEKFEEHIQQYETITDIIDQNVNLIKLLDGEDAYKSLGIYYKMQKENNLQQLDFQRQEVELWRQRMDGAEQGSEEWLAYREQWQTAVKDLNDTVASSIENLIAEYQNTVQSIFKDLNDKLTKGKGLEYVQEEWDLINKEAERYLDSVNATFEIQQLQYKYIDALNNIDSLHTQNKLNNLMNEQLEMLREKDKLTQYDVDRANLLYEIELKRIALEEAQRNKSEMRLRRDAQGNYSYQYVANKDKINEAQRELGAAQNELWNLDKEAYTGNLDDFNSTMSEFQEAYAKLMSDQTLSEEEKERRKVLLQEHYGNIINQMIAENENIRYNLSAASIDAFADYQGTIIMENLVPQWNSGIQEMIDSFIAEGGFLPSCQGAFNQLDEATKTYQDSLKDLEKTAGMNFSNIRLGIDESIAHTQAFIEKNEDLIAEYDKELDRIEEIYKEVKKLIKKYEESEAAAKKAAKAAYEFAQAAREAAAAAAAMNSAAGGGGSSSSGSGGGGGSSSGSSGSGGGSSPKKQSGGDDSDKTNKNKYTKTGQLGWSFNGNTGEQKPLYGVRDGNGNLIASGLTSDEINKKYGLATGGYTGTWADGDKKGKLALLHQKELVLNAKDTSNILTAVKSVRSMQDILSALNTSMQARTGSLLSDLLNHRNNLNNGNNIVQQKVYIEAKFEGQTESAQIEKALDNLVNYASQYAFASSRF